MSAPQSGSPESAGEATRLLRRVSRGDQEAAEQLLPMVYDELRRVARNCFRREGPGHTLQPTALVHEAWMRLFEGEQPEYESRRHFLAVAAITMRRVLVDHARARDTRKRGSQWSRVAFENAREAGDDGPDFEVLAVHEALEKLATLSPRQAQVVELRWFGGMTVPEVSEHLGAATRTIEQDWTAARAWLRVELGSG